MAIISDGVTSITIENVDEQIDLNLISASKLSAGGQTKNQVAGEKFKLKCKAALTGTVLRSLFNLLQNNATAYYYTAEDTHSLYSNVTFPISCKIDKFKSKFDNRSTYYIDFNVESNDYI